MPVFAWLCAFVVGGTLIPVALHTTMHGFNIHQAGIAFFLWVNVLICIWELVLFRHITMIELQYQQFQAQYRGRELERVLAFFGRPISFFEAITPSTWAEVWSSYGLFDESYADRRSFGFFIDVGNGISTLVPCVLCAYAMTLPIVSARVLGLMLLIFNYQMWYGTIVYFMSFLFNRRWEGHSPFNLAVFVGMANGMWFVFPMWAMWAGVRLIVTNDFSVFGV